jgi:hypothetical protein
MGQSRMDNSDILAKLYTNQDRHDPSYKHHKQRKQDMALPTNITNNVNKT